MRLVNLKTNRPILEFKEGKPIFYSKFFEHEMCEMGIEIPHGLRGTYHGKTTITPYDGDFEKAFREIYYATYMNPDQFKWRSN